MYPCTISFLFLSRSWLYNKDGLYDEEDTCGLGELRSGQWDCNRCIYEGRTGCPENKMRSLLKTEAYEQSVWQSV